LRAELEVESFVTGQLLVELVSRPGTEPVLRGGDNPPYPEIPTIQSEIQEMLAKVRTLIGDISEGFDAKELGQRFQSVLQGMDELVHSEDLRETLAGINSITNREETQELTATLQTTLKEIRSAASDAGVLFQDVDGKLDTLETDLKPVLERFVAALDEAQATLTAAKFQLQGESIESHQLGTTLREVEGAARALREFLDYLERNPEAILRGKQQ
jgi:paraquat-inducible protein B